MVCSSLWERKRSGSSGAEEDRPRSRLVEDLVILPLTSVKAAGAASAAVTETFAYLPFQAKNPFRVCARALDGNWWILGHDQLPLGLEPAVVDSFRLCPSQLVRMVLEQQQSPVISPYTNT
jgi:hypothetical protein